MQQATELYRQTAQDIEILERARRTLGGELFVTLRGKIVLRIASIGFTGICYQHLSPASAAEKAGI